MRCARGDETAFGHLVIFYRPLLLPFITSITKSQSRAEEVVQDVFVQIWLSRESIQQIRDFRSFLFVISKNLALNALRSILRERTRLGKWKEMNNEPIVQQPAEMPELANLLHQAIEQLPPQQKQAWTGVRKEGRKLHEVAEEMRISKATVKKYIWYANNNIVAFLSKRTEFLVLLAIFCKKDFLP